MCRKRGQSKELNIWWQHAVMALRSCIYTDCFLCIEHHCCHSPVTYVLLTTISHACTEQANRLTERLSQTAHSKH